MIKNYYSPTDFETCQQVLCNTHTELQLNSTENGSYHCTVRESWLGDVKIQECQTSAISGLRTTTEISKSDQNYFGVLLIQEGSECIRQDGRETVLNPGDLFIWSNEEELSFQVTDTFRKTSLIIPGQRIRELIPWPEDFSWARIPNTNAMSNILANQIKMLCSNLEEIPDSCAKPVIENTLELLRITVSGQEKQSFGSLPKEILLRSILDFIEKNLCDPRLSPSMISEVFGISSRYIYTLFKGKETSISKWIRERRLVKCKGDLSNPALNRHSITELALKWGFNDSAHFSNLFRSQYGVSPRELRKSKKH